MEEGKEEEGLTGKKGRKERVEEGSGEGKGAGGWKEEGKGMIMRGMRKTGRRVV